MHTGFKKNNTKLGGKNADRFIPKKTSQKIYRGGSYLKNFSLAQVQLFEKSSSLSPERTSSPEFFNNLRDTGHYDSINISSPETSFANTNNDNNTNTNNNNSHNNTSRTQSRQIAEQKKHRKYIADSLGFHSPSRVFNFHNSTQEYSIESNNDQTVLLHEQEHYDRSVLDPLVSSLLPSDAANYLAKASLSAESLLKNKNARPNKRIKSHIPYRVLDAPCLRNDFYSHLVSWSKTSNNVVVGLGSSIYIWSDKDGAIPILDNTFLKNKQDVVTCVSFCPKNFLLVVGTKKGRLLLFDQEVSIKEYKKKTAAGIPLAEYQSTSLRGICCVEWFANCTSTHSKLLIGEECGDITCLTISESSSNIAQASSGESTNFKYINGGNDNSHRKQTKRSKIKSSFETEERWQIEYNSKFQAQAQQVCGLSLNDDNCILAVGGNDNSCTLWDITDLKAVKLVFVLPHKAAVKAVAFCPWSRSLLATGGGSKDRTIKFWHVKTGTLLNEIHTSGQVTSLVWSTRHKQIVATFGFGEIEEPTLMTLYTYPKLEPILHAKSPVPLRVLSAVVSPSFTSICMATNDETIRFYELWKEDHPVIQESQESGLYGSHIIEYVEGIASHQNECIR